MKLEDIENLRKSYLDQSNDDLGDMDIDELHRELLPLIKNRKELEASKKEFSKNVNDTLTLIKVLLARVTQEIDKFEKIIEEEFPMEDAV